MIRIPTYRYTYVGIPTFVYRSYVGMHVSDAERPHDSDGAISFTVGRINPRPAGPLDFPPPAWGRGGGAFERPHDLSSWSS